MALHLAAHPAVAAIRGWHADLTGIRRQLHRNPELGFEEHLTGALVAKQLERYGVDEIHRGIGKTGLVAVIRGRRTGWTRTPPGSSFSPAPGISAGCSSTSSSPVR